MQDEVQIIDFGRVVLEQETDWALTWDIVHAVPILPTSYLGPLLHEVAFWITRPSNLGPRIFSLLSAVLAASLLLGWLLARHTPNWMALGLATAFLTDPIFSETYRSARVDGLAISCVFAACWLLNAGKFESNFFTRGDRAIFLAGVLFITSVFVWPTALMLAPLIIVEFTALQRIHKHDSKIGQIKQIGVLSTILGAGIVAGAIVFGLPIFARWEEYLLGLESAIAVQTFAASINNSLLDLFAAHDPIIALVGLVALSIRRSAAILIAFSISLLMAYQTMIYAPRILYLLPYIILMFAEAVRISWQKNDGKVSKFLLRRCLAALLLWNIGVVLVIRPIDRFQIEPINMSTESYSTLKSAIGEGDYRVLMGDWSIYFAARELGWQVFAPWTGISQPEYLSFLMSLDYVIIRENPLFKLTRDLMPEAGFKHITRIEIPSQHMENSHSENTAGFVHGDETLKLLIYRKNQ